MKKKVMIAVLLALGVAAGCGGGGEDRTGGCDEAEDWVVALRDLDLPSASSADMDELEAGIADYEATQDLFRKAQAAAPDDVSEAMEVIDQADTESVRLDDQEAQSDAWATVEDWLEDDCRLALPS